MKQRLAILGSTGSIGVQTLDIVRETPSLFEVRVLTANRNWQRLAAQAREFDADTAVIADERYYGQLRDALAGTDVKVYAGEDAVAQVAAGGDTDVVVNALVGYAGLAPTVAALGAGKKLALANKESLVVGGEYVMRLAAEKRAPILRSTRNIRPSSSAWWASSRPYGGSSSRAAAAHSATCRAKNWPT